ncbi:uncharacterized protein LOC136075478 [Hydra vulgaris]|uniref:uncharacterized protein LOC136075478 n=1 Tax=Hydra vulgaris TaxID=6087 RepID=UPI0001923E6D
MGDIFYSNNKQELSVAVVGGGISGSTVAIKLAKHKINVSLFEASDSLVNGPPFCHLHAGGNLYREISDVACVTLLKESIEIIKMYPNTISARPTLIIVPIHDYGEPNDLLPRLRVVQSAYASLVDENPQNELLGLPCDYFKTFSKEHIKKLRHFENPLNPVTFEEWLIPVTKHLNFKKIKFPVIMVQEYGWCTLRLAANVQLIIKNLKNCHVHLKSKVTDVKLIENQWHIQYRTNNPLTLEHETRFKKVDYLINACGYQTGFIDDLIQLNCKEMTELLTCKRMIEFKASYLCQWKECSGNWPGVVIHGERGTPNGMIQLTPYPGKLFQLHGMTQDITLFKDGLALSTNTSFQPKFSKKINKMLSLSWEKDEVEKRTDAAIQYAAQYILGFLTATHAGPALFGAQQIPGSDPNLRTGGVRFVGNNYIIIEIVKALSATSASTKVLKHIYDNLKKKDGSFEENGKNLFDNEAETNLDITPSSNEITDLAIFLANSRGYPNELAKMINAYKLNLNCSC